MNREKQKWTRKKTTHDSYIRTPVSQPLYMHTNANVCPAFFRLISCSSCCLFLLPHFLFLLSFFSIILWVFSLPSWYFSFVKGAFVFDGCVCVCVYSLGDENSVLCGVKTGTKTLSYMHVHTPYASLALALVMMHFENGTKPTNKIEGTHTLSTRFVNIVQVNRSVFLSHFFSRFVYMIRTNTQLQMQLHAHGKFNVKYTSEKDPFAFE